MKKCKVKSCNEKHWAEGYCFLHYQRIRRGKPLIKKCKDCKEVIEHLKKCRYCKGCAKKHQKENYDRRVKKLKEEYVSIPRFAIKGKVGGHSNVYVNGVKEEIKPLIPKIKDAVLNDCYKNPRKYLDEKQLINN